MNNLFDLQSTSGAGAESDFETLRAQAVLDEAMADHAFGRALDQARDLGGRAGLRRLGAYSGRIAALEAEILADHVPDDGNTKRAERLLDDGKTSKREQRQKAARAKAVGQNADLASKMAAGEMSEEQVDVIAAAAAKTDGDAAVDADLIDKVAAVPPEQGRGFADEYVADRATADGVQNEYNRQRALRRASKYNSKKSGLATISIEGDSVAVDAMWKAIQHRSDLLYKRDGGSDLPLAKHPRTNDYRNFDAAHQLLCGLNTNGRDSDTTAAEAETTSAGSKARPSRRHTPKAARAARPRIVIGLTVDKLLGKDPAAIATQIGLGHIPDSVLADYASDAEIMAALFDRNGEPLWVGRLNRYATTTQRIALILRDRGCVLCGADHTQCQAHHSMPSNAPGKGRTDLDNLVLLCERCHRDLHNANRTIYQDTNHTWRTRPATPDETPPSKPDTSRNRVRRE